MIAQKHSETPLALKNKIFHIGEGGDCLWKDLGNPDTFRYSIRMQN